VLVARKKKKDCVKVALKLMGIVENGQNQDNVLYINAFSYVLYVKGFCSYIFFAHAL
jgi:hypothetical protein